MRYAGDLLHAKRVSLPCRGNLPAANLQTTKSYTPSKSATELHTQGMKAVASPPPQYLVLRGILPLKLEAPIKSDHCRGGCASIWLQ